MFVAAPIVTNAIVIADSQVIYIMGIYTRPVMRWYINFDIFIKINKYRFECVTKRDAFFLHSVVWLNGN